MTVLELMRAIADLDPGASVMIDLGPDHWFLEAAVRVDPEGVRIILDPEDEESAVAHERLRSALN